MKIPDRIKENFSIGPCTTIGLGGHARYFSQCKTIDQIRENLRWAESHGVSTELIGGGSNIIFPDSGYDGLVLQIALQGIRYTHKGVTAAAGEIWDKIVEHSTKIGLAGLECLSGIPGYVGATPIQNIGAYGQEVSDTILWVEAIDRTSLEVIRIPGKECHFKYRQSRFKNSDADKYIITSVHYRLNPQGIPTFSYPELRKQINKELLGQRGPGALIATRNAVLKLRRSKSMVLDVKDPDSRSVGSFFLNPIIDYQKANKLKSNYPKLPHYAFMEKIKIPAAWLVENAGFTKGYKYGGVGISNRHALALVNHNGSTAELLKLAEKIKETVLSKFGIELKYEPKIIGSK